MHHEHIYTCMFNNYTTGCNSEETLDIIVDHIVSHMDMNNAIMLLLIAEGVYNVGQVTHKVTHNSQLACWFDFDETDGLFTLNRVICDSLKRHTRSRNESITTLHKILLTLND